MTVEKRKQILNLKIEELKTLMNKMTIIANESKEPVIKQGILKSILIINLIIEGIRTVEQSL